MALSLAVIAGIAMLLPGLFAMLFWNLRGRRHGGSRPDLPITAVSVLSFSIAISLAAHVMTWLFGNVVIQTAVLLGNELPSWAVIGPAIRNPVETMLALGRGGTAAGLISPGEIAAAVGTLGLEIMVVVSFLADDGLDLALDGVDFGNQGWVYTKILRPAQNDFRPIAFVLTTLMKDGLGVGYRGTVADIRQSDRGETLAITLGEPARFLFELKAGKAPSGYGGEGENPQFIRYAEEDVGSAVALDARVIQNIVVSNRRSSQLKLLADLEAARLQETIANRDD